MSVCWFVFGLPDACLEYMDVSNLCSDNKARMRAVALTTIPRPHPLVLPRSPSLRLFATRCYGLGRVLASACIRSVLLLTLSM